MRTIRLSYSWLRAVNEQPLTFLVLGWATMFLATWVLLTLLD